ncbi:MAG TPA: response regulator transcription factor [Nitrospiria bacterium]|nr:response regulator transcription factor [Nitrospiria bacterium]
MLPQILLADDHVIVRQGLKALLEKEGFPVIAEASNGHEAIRMAGEHHPDVAVLDLAMPALNGLDTAGEILHAHPKMKAVLLTMHTEERYVLEALRIGVRGYVLKSHAARDLIQAIHDVYRGTTYLSPGISQTVVAAYLAKTDFPPDALTRRERQVLQLIAEGKTTKEAADVLNVSVKTAESHRMRIMEKLDIHGTAGLVRYAIRRGLVEP